MVCDNFPNLGRGRLIKSSDPNAFSIIDQIKAISKDHETAGLLHELIETDGAGSWPPRASLSWRYVAASASPVSPHLFAACIGWVI
jgi:hypothetical protein